MERGLREPARSTDRAVGAYVLKETIGSGSYGKVKLAYSTKTREYVAIKVQPRRPDAK